MKIIKFIIFDIIKNKWLTTYTVFLLILTSGIIYFSNDSGKAIISLTNVILILIPLMSVTFSSMHYYNSKEFIQMLLTQPIERVTVFIAEFISISVSLVLAFLIGVILPLLFNGFSILIFYLIISGTMLSLIFCAVAILISISFDEKIKGVVISLFTWLFFSVIYDGFVLYIYFAFNEYPLENIVLLLTALNPVDISRILILLKLEISSLMGYTGANLQNILGNNIGFLLSVFVLLTWAVIPFLLALRKFNRKNF